MNNIIVEHENSHIVILEKDYSVCYINDVFLKHYPILKKCKNFFANFLRVQDEDFATNLKTAVENVERTKEPSNFSIKVLDKYNEYRYFSAKIIPLFDSKFNLDKFLLSFIDITDKVSDKNQKLKKLPVLIGKDIGFVDLKDICYIKADNMFSLVYCLEAEHICPISLGKLEGLLPAEIFVRTHKSYIINIERIDRLKKYDNNTYQLLIENKKTATIPVSRRKSRSILNIFGLR